jgi:hypothetical protein
MDRLITRRTWHATRFGALVVATLLVAHDAIYVMRFGTGAGYASGMAATGHGYWDAFTAWGLLSGAVLLAGALAMLSRLSRSAARTRQPSIARTTWAAELAHLWPRLLVAVTIGFVAQEGIEHAVFFGHLPTLDEMATALGPSSAGPLALVTFVVAALGALVRWRIAELRARVAGRPLQRRRPRADSAARPGWRIAAALRRHAYLIVRLDAGRAPPAASI